MGLVESSHESVDVYQFWCSNSAILPRLSDVALKILPAPATISSCERDFSFAGLFVESRKANLSPENLNAKILLAANKELIKALDPIV